MARCWGLDIKAERWNKSVTYKQFEKIDDYESILFNTKKVLVQKQVNVIIDCL